MTEFIEQGASGCYYLTDGDDRGVFIAANSAQEARQLAPYARLALRTGQDSVPNHVLHDHANGGRVTIPTPDGMTPEQMQETITRLHLHLKRFTI